MTFYVYSTATCDTKFAIYSPPSDKNSLPKTIHTILVKGGNMVAQKNLYTPKGVMTEVSDEDMALLEKDPHYIEAKRLGFYTSEKKPADIKKVVKDMKEKDASAPKVPSDFKNKKVKDDDDGADI